MSTDDDKTPTPSEEFRREFEMSTVLGSGELDYPWYIKRAREGHSVELGGVKIQKCNSEGRTEAEQTLYDLAQIKKPATPPATDLHLRQMALSEANKFLSPHGSDEKLVQTAEAFLTFLKGTTS